MSRFSTIAVVVALVACQASSPMGVDAPLEIAKADSFSDGGDSCDDGPCLRSRDASAEIDRYNAGLSDEDREAKYCKMASSPFVFYRGTNHLFWLDLGRDARLSYFGVASGGESTRIWLQGDLHVENFGAYDDDEGTVVYGLNDFDEAVIADYQLDLWRMATSLVLVAQQSGLQDEDVTEILDGFTESYLDTVADYRGNDDEEGMIYTEQTTIGRLDDFLREVEEEESREDMLEKWTVLVEGDRRFDLDSSKLERATEGEAAAIVGSMAGYLETLTGGLDADPAYFEVKDVARRVLAGTGSLGTPRFYVLIEGETDDPDDDRILDVKRQGTSTPALYLGDSPELSGLAVNEAHRTTLAYRAMSVHVDDHLGWMMMVDGPYSVRERSPFKDSLPLDELTRAGDFEKVAEQWGAILATAHARADRDFDARAVPYSFEANVDDLTDGLHGDFRALVRSIALEYARQVNSDYQAFLRHFPDDASCADSTSND